jgi:hypothetical protein
MTLLWCPAGSSAVPVVAKGEGEEEGEVATLSGGSQSAATWVLAAEPSVAPGAWLGGTKGVRWFVRTPLDSLGDADPGQVENAKSKKNNQVTKTLIPSRSARVDKFDRFSGTETLMPPRTMVFTSTTRRIKVMNHRHTGVRGTNIHRAE